MSKRLTLALISGVLGTIISVGAQATPLAPAPAPKTQPDITLVAGGCGVGFHRGPYGYCVRNGVPYGYAPPGYLPPPVYAPPPPVAAPGWCAYGYYLGPNRRCYPY